jgi:hypothetical protein
MTQHSALVGGSTADRILNCPGSFQATLVLPPSANRVSEFANEGSAMHAVMDRLMYIRQTGGGPQPDLFKMARNFIGQTFHDRELTQEHLDTLVYPALTALFELEADHGGSYEVLAVEQAVRFPGIPGAFGTVDLILGNATVVLLVDWKFGSGIPVKAQYRVNDGFVVNPQLMFYAAAAKHSARHLFKGGPDIILAIVQPRADPPRHHVVIEPKELRWFTQDLQAAVVKATSRDPERRKGEWCRFAPCKINCPLWTGPLLELAELLPVQRDTAPAHVTPYGEYLSRVKSLVDLLAMLKKEVDEQLHAYLTDGGKVPGWRLKAKVKQRQWIEEGIVAGELHKLGFKPDEIWQEKLQTFAAADAAAKRLGVKIPDHLRVAPPSNETTVAPTDDPAPVVDPARAVEAVREALALLK